MVSTAIGLSHILVVTGFVFPVVYAKTHGAESLAEARMLMLAPTRFAVHYFWLFPALLAISCVTFVRATSRRNGEVAEILTCGLCVQGLVAWSAAFCFCFDAFTGPMCLHHGPEFEFGTFLTACLGVFSVTFATLLAPIVLVLSPKIFGKGKEEAERIKIDRAKPRSIE